jgi:hypothetical protein
MNLRRLAALIALTCAAVAACSDMPEPMSPDVAATASLSSSKPGGPKGGPQRDEWDRVLADTVVQGNVVVPAGERWLIGQNVEVAGNVLVQDATVAMRPGSSLKFLGNMAQYTGGPNMHYDPSVDQDWGLWVWGTGQLDVSCTPKQSWNRTGSHATWRADDEYWISPTAAGDYWPRRWSPGDAVPQADPRVPAAEVMNITRDCVIEGPGHIHINSSVPQRIEYVELRGLGVWTAERDLTTGRYGLHLHMMGDGSRGTLVRGVSAIDSRGRVFVAHTSHGVTFEDLVSVNSWGTGMWWDPGHRTDDFVAERIAISGVNLPRSVSGSTPRGNAIALGSGTNMTIRNSAVSGASGSDRSNGFDWNTLEVHRNPAKWTFDQGNVAHNNQGRGIRFWFNDNDAHHVQNHTSYNNGAFCLENGAYANAVRYTNVLCLNEGAFHQTSARSSELGASGYHNVEIIASDGPALQTGHRRLDASDYLEVVDSKLVPAAGHPKVLVRDSDRFPFRAVFRRSGMTPADIVWESYDGPGNDGSHVIIEHEDGRVWDLRVSSGKLSVTLR